MRKKYFSFKLELNLPSQYFIIAECTSVLERIRLIFSINSNTTQCLLRTCKLVSSTSFTSRNLHSPKTLKSFTNTLSKTTTTLQRKTKKKKQLEDISTVKLIIIKHKRLVQSSHTPLLNIPVLKLISRILAALVNFNIKLDVESISSI